MKRLKLKKSSNLPNIENNKSNNNYQKKINVSNLNKSNNTINNNENLLSNNINQNSQNYQDYIYGPQSYSNGNQPNLDFDNDTNSENIKVCLRIRPMSLQEKSRNDIPCIEAVSNEQLILTHKSLRRS
jgi:hypothetical protein